MAKDKQPKEDEVLTAGEDPKPTKDEETNAVGENIPTVEPPVEEQPQEPEVEKVAEAEVVAPEKEPITLQDILSFLHFIAAKALSSQEYNDLRHNFPKFFD